MGKKGRIRGHIDFTIGKLVSATLRKQQNKFDANIIFAGNRGLGKSTAAVKFALRFPQFKMSRDVLFSREDVIHHLATRKKSVIIADEMINVSFNRDFSVNEQKKLIKIMNMYRDSQNVLLMCVPHFANLDKQLLGLTQLRVDIIRRGLGVVHRPLQYSFGRDNWDIDKNLKIEQNFTRRGIFKPQYKNLSTYCGLLTIPNLTEKQRILYEKIKQEKRNVLYDGDSDIEIEENKAKYNIPYRMLKDGHLNKESLMALCKYNNWKYNNVLQRLTAYLRKEGLSHSPAFYFKNSELPDTSLISNKILEKNDSLV